MFSVLLKHLSWLIWENRNKEKDEARRKFEVNLRALEEPSDEEEGPDDDNNNIQEPVAELAYSCSKYEGKRVKIKLKSFLNYLQQVSSHLSRTTVGSSMTNTVSTKPKHWMCGMCSKSEARSLFSSTKIQSSH